MIQPPMRSWFRYKIQGTADLCTEIMAKKVEVPGAFPMCPAENHRSHLFGGPLPGEPALSWHTKEADNKSSCSGLMVTSKKIDLFFFTLIHQSVFKNGGLNCSTSFWGRQKHQPFLPSPGVLGFQGSAQHQEDAASEPRHGHGDGRHFVDPTTDAEYRGNGQTRPRKWRPGPERWKKNEAGGAVSKQNNVTKLNWLLFGNFTWQWSPIFKKNEI